MLGWRDYFFKLGVDARKAYAKKYIGSSPIRFGELPSLKDTEIPKMSKWEMIDFARRHCLFNITDFFKGVQEYIPDEPITYNQVVFLFGSFRTFMDEVRNSPNIKYWNKRMTDRDFAILCSRLHIRNKEHYKKFRLEHPELDLPEQKQVADRFGSWELFMTVMRSFSIDEQIDLYFRESYLRGRPLTHRECKSVGVDIVFLKQLLTEDLLTRILNEKEKWYILNRPDFLKGKHVKDVLKVSDKAKYKEKYSKNRRSCKENENSRRSEKGTGKTVSVSPSAS